MAAWFIFTEKGNLPAALVGGLKAARHEAKREGVIYVDMAFYLNALDCYHLGRTLGRQEGERMVTNARGGLFGERIQPDKPYNNDLFDDGSLMRFMNVPVYPSNEDVSYLEARKKCD